MPKYIVELEFTEGSEDLEESASAEACQAAVERNSDFGVTWIQSFVTESRTKSFSLYDAPSPEAIRKAAARNHLSVERISRVQVLDPHFFH